MQGKQKVVRIGCSSAFWGDSASGAWQLVNREGSNLHYLVADYLAEVTMGILARSKDNAAATGGSGDGGYIAEFAQVVWKPLMKQIIKHNIKVVTNAGGMNPLGLKNAIEKVTRDAGLPVPVVAAITGDDLASQVEALKAKGAFADFAEVPGEGEPKWHENPRCKMMSFNAYFGAFPIVDALQKGAQIVITGRCADSALVLGPLIHEFGWKANEYDLLSAGSLAGHIIECACQATGGNFTDWKKSLAGRDNVGDDEEVTENSWLDVGFPIVECSGDGSFVVTKPQGTGGLVSKATVAEQMLYEIHNPSAYLLPDVVCDWQHVTINQVEGEENRVQVYGAKGKPPTPFYKISATSVDGFKLDGMLVIGGFDARKKALAVGKAILARASRILTLRGIPDFTATNLEVLGTEHTYGPHARKEVQESREVVLRISVHHHDVMALGIFGREVAPAATSMAPGITGGGSGRPRPQPLVRHSSVLVKKELVPVTVHVGPDFHYTGAYTHPTYTVDLPPPFTSPETPLSSLLPSGIETIQVPLVKLCCGRSGDKGDIANIGVFVRKREYYPLVKAVLTEKAVHDYMAHTMSGKVKRFEVPGIQGLNFVLTQALGGGGMASLNIDRQGKAYAQMLLSFPVTVPKSWFAANNGAKL